MTPATPPEKRCENGSLPPGGGCFETIPPQTPLGGGLNGNPAPALREKLNGACVIPLGMELQFCQSIANYNIGRFTTRKKEACSMLDVANRFLRKCVGDVLAMLLGCVGMRCNGANSRPEWNQNASRMKPKGSPKRSKMEPKVIQNGTKRDQDTAKGSVVKKKKIFI